MIKLSFIIPIFTKSVRNPLRTGRIRIPSQAQYRYVLYLYRRNERRDADANCILECTKKGGNYV